MYAGDGWKAPMFSVAAPGAKPILMPLPVLPRWPGKGMSSALGNVPGQHHRACAEAARGENNCSRREHAIFAIEPDASRRDDYAGQIGTTL
jgi:hypothetical protein